MYIVIHRNRNIAPSIDNNWLSVGAAVDQCPLQLYLPLSHSPSMLQTNKEDIFTYLQNICAAVVDPVLSVLM